MSDSVNPQGSNQSNSLRDRIAAVLESVRPATPLEAADALIANFSGAEIAQMLRVRIKCKQCGWIPANRWKADND